jgi:hypothetical protein
MSFSCTKITPSRQRIDSRVQFTEYNDPRRSRRTQEVVSRDDSELGARLGKVFQVSVVVWLAILCLPLLALQRLDFVF